MEFTVTVKEKAFNLNSLAGNIEVVSSSVDELMMSTCAHCGKRIKNIVVIKDNEGRKHEVGLTCARNLLQGNIYTTRFNFHEGLFKKASALSHEIKRMIIRYGELTFIARSKNENTLLDYYYMRDGVLNMIGTINTADHNGLKSLVDHIPYIKAHLFSIDLQEFHNKYYGDDGLLPINGGNLYNFSFMLDCNHPIKNRPSDGIYRGTVTISYKGSRIGNFYGSGRIYGQMIGELQTIARNVIYDYALTESIEPLSI